VITRPEGTTDLATSLFGIKVWDSNQLRKSEKGRNLNTAVVDTPTSYSGGPRFESRSERR
jgi:hypothetical protein